MRVGWGDSMFLEHFLTHKFVNASNALQRIQENITERKEDKTRKKYSNMRTKFY